MINKEEIVNKITEKYKEIIDILKLKENGIPEEHILDTPKRIAKMLVYELFEGVYNDPPKITTFTFNNSTVIPVTLSNIKIKSVCSHHFVPFVGKGIIQYLPNEKIIGISKLARIANYFSRRPQVQEELTNQIGEYIFEVLNPKYVAVVISAKHLCISHRGANEPDTEMITTYYKESVLNNYDCSENIVIDRLLNLLK